MKIACIGTGFVGVVTAAVLAKLGNNVIGLDIDQSKIEKLKVGTVPFFEPGLSELLIETQKNGHLSFTTDYAQAVKDADVIMIMVGTPSSADGSADLTYVYQVAESAAPHLQANAVIVVKSTVPPGTNEEVKRIIAAKTKVTFHVASVPEFLKEGTAVEDTLHPDRIVLGVESSHARDILTTLHTPLTSNILVMNPESAQMVKYAANNYLATRITFINQIADLCEYNGADIEEVIRGIGADRRIGSHYWYPGLGYGGSCFPKDVKELAHYAQSVGETNHLSQTIDLLNTTRIKQKMSQYAKKIGGFGGKTVAVLGLSFKKNTNDTREAPANYVIPWLLEQGAIVRATDPQAIAVAQQYLPQSVIYPSTVTETATGADVIILLVEWDEYQNLDFVSLKKLMTKNPVFIDTRNQYDSNVVTAAGFDYLGIGR